VTTSSSILSSDDTILVTGSSGFIGSKVVETLLGRGLTKIRCFVRSPSRLGRLESVLNRCDRDGRVEIVAGDLTSPDSCAAAARGVSVVYHLAAGMEKSFAGAFLNSALATRNLIESFLQLGHPKRFVNVSSFAVYSHLASKGVPLVDERSPLEVAPQERYDAYGFGKLKQEEIVRSYSDRGLRFVILRPGAVFGPGKKELSGRIAIDTFGFFIQIGGSHLVPHTYVDNCAEAIVLAGLVAGVDGEVFNVVDDELLTARQFLKAYRQRAGRFRCIRIPYWLGYGLCTLWEEYSRRSEGQLPPAFNRRRCAAEWKRCRFSNQKLKERLGWAPRVRMDAAMSAFLGQFDTPAKGPGK
jgi:nucleoside-diphosphate-sugar epimerase